MHAQHGVTSGAKTLGGRNIMPPMSTTVLTYFVSPTKACSRCLQSLLDCS